MREKHIYLCEYSAVAKVTFFGVWVSVFVHAIFACANVHQEDWKHCLLNARKRHFAVRIYKFNKT